MSDSSDNDQARLPELDWFDFETRMRHVVAELLEPTIKRVKEEREICDQLQHKYEGMLKRIDNVEVLLGVGKSSAILRDELMSHINEVRADRKARDVYMEGVIKSLKEMDTHNQDQISLNRGLAAQLDSRINTLVTSMDTYSQTMEDNKNIVVGRVGELTHKVEEIDHSLNSQMEKTHQTVVDSGKRITDLSGKINSQHNILEGFQKTIREIQGQILKLQNDKATYDDLQDLRQYSDEKMQKTMETINELTNDFKSVKRYLDVYLPLETYNLVSSSLYLTLEKVQLVRYLPFEQEKLKKLQENITVIKADVLTDDLVRRAIDECRQADNRKSEFMLRLKKIKYQNDIEAIDKRNQESPTLAEQQSQESLHPDASQESIKVVENVQQVNESHDSIPKSVYNSFLFPESQKSPVPQISKEEVQEIKAFMQELQYLRQEVVGRVKDEIQKFKQNHISAEEESRILISMVQSNSEQFAETFRKDKESIFHDMRKLIEDCQNIMQTAQSHTNQIKTLTELNAVLVEFSLITHALLSQDEEDKQSIQLTGLKEQAGTTLPNIYRKPAVSISQDCLACSGNATVKQAFKLACLSYQPTPLKYRNTVYNRSQLLEVMGQMLQNSWSKASIRPPYDNFTTTPKRIGRRLKERDPHEPPSGARTVRNASQVLQQCYQQIKPQAKIWQAPQLDASVLPHELGPRGKQAYPCLGNFLLRHTPIIYIPLSYLMPSLYYEAEQGPLIFSQR